MIKAIIFDIGGVLDKGGWKEHYLPMCKELGIDKDKFSKSQKKHVKKAKIGKIITSEYMLLVAKDLGINKKELYRSWIKWKRKALVKDRNVEKIIKELKDKGYIVGTLTNIVEIHEKIRLEKKIYDLFDFKLRSFKEKCCKPQLKFYKLIFKKLKKVKPSEIIFIDDWDGALIPAKKLGMKTILFKDAEQLKSDLKRFRVKI